MSDVSQGPGWWQAADGKWYPPETHPDPNYRQMHGSQQSTSDYGVGYPQSSSRVYSQRGSNGFLASMFDLSFDDFITTKIARALLIAMWLIEICATLVFVAVMIHKGGVGGAILSIFVIAVGFLCMILTRVWIELFIALIKVAENTAQVAKNTTIK